MTAHTWRHLVLGALCAILGAALWLEVDAAREARERGAAPAPARPRAAAPGSNPVFALPPREAFGDIVARPLFWASRRPIAEASAAAAAPSDLALLGVLLARDETVAIIRHGKPPRVDRIREGAVLEGWKLVEVALNRVLLERGATRVELKSKDPHPPAPAAPVAPKPPQPTPPQAPPARSGD